MSVVIVCLPAKVRRQVTWQRPGPRRHAIADLQQIDAANRSAVTEVEPPADGGAVAHHDCVLDIEPDRAVGGQLLPELKIGRIAFIAFMAFSIRLPVTSIRSIWIRTGTRLPGPGNVYIKRGLEFGAPVKVRASVEAQVLITSLEPER